MRIISSDREEPLHVCVWLSPPRVSDCSVTWAYAPWCFWPLFTFPHSHLLWQKLHIPVFGSLKTEWLWVVVFLPRGQELASRNHCTGIWIAWGWVWASKEMGKWHLWRVQCDQTGRTQNHYSLNYLFYPLSFSLAGWLRPFQSFPEGLSAADLLWKSSLRCPGDSERAALPGPRGGSTRGFSHDKQFVGLYFITPQCIVHTD